ncbi:MAG: hypothetical protein IGR80_12350 [Synechococcales cyanobacterium K44_A2020_017]|nr:hypothetical protein [Synechococcales cyanobacterium K32_A2020_035]MBF2095536.1 hypothetical protein [Synechococcales cyanobacterium K44_A2020_017]
MSVLASAAAEEDDRSERCQGRRGNHTVHSILLSCIKQYLNCPKKRLYTSLLAIPLQEAGAGRSLWVGVGPQHEQVWRSLVDPHKIPICLTLSVSSSTYKNNCT